MADPREIRHFHLFCGLGGGARGFNQGHARVGSMQARFRCIGGVDSDPAGLADFERLSGARGTLLDLFSRDQYIAFHECEPPADWREATPADFHRAAGYERPHVVFLSAPCKGFSGLLPESRSRTGKYQALNALALRGLMLVLEAWGDDPVPFILFENVPRIQTRGRHLLDQIESLLTQYGYASAETTHDCGELGGLAQTRRRFLLVARHRDKVPPFLYEPVKRPLRAVGDVLGPMPLPGDERAGPMHRVPALQWRTWVRLAFVEAGSDWRSLKRLRVENGYLADYALAPDQEWYRGSLGVHRWSDTASTVTSEARPQNGAFSIADPRFDGHEYGQFGVNAWDRSVGTVTSQRSPGQGRFAIADPRVGGVRHNNVFRVVRWADVSQSVTGGAGPSAGGLAIADPRTKYGDNAHRNKLAMVGWNESAKTVTGANQVQGGALSVADPRPGLERQPGADYATAGHYGVVPWDSPSYAVTGSARHDNGHHNVADPRLPASNDRLVAIIRALDNTWHRPFTTLELAALQGLIDPGERFELDGRSDSAWRERIGNAVPPPAAAAIASVIGQALLLAWAGETFVLGSTPIWVRDVAVAIAVDRKLEEGDRP